MPREEKTVCASSFLFDFQLCAKQMILNDCMHMVLSIVCEGASFCFPGKKKFEQSE